MNQGEFLFSDNDTPAPKPRAKKTRQPKRAATKTPSASAPPAPQQKLPDRLSVTQLTRLIKMVLGDNLPGRIVLEGEVSNFKRHGSGHLYLTLKDADSQISAVMWRSHAGKVRFDMSDGLAVVATGYVDIFEPQGKYQFYIEKIEPSGQGALELALRQLAEKLRNEGLFNAEHKKPLPRFPATIAIVTSATGAAIKDISQTLQRRWPIARKLLYPVAVQGDAAAPQIARAIREMNAQAEQLGGIDVMIVGRGGGSMEDLWAFNEEVVARAIFASQIPVISAVGHEVDVTIADMVADARAATPTAAAELAAPVLTDVLVDVNQAHARLARTMHNAIERARLRLAQLQAQPLFSRPTETVMLRQQCLDDLAARLQQSQYELLQFTRQRLDAHQQALQQIEPHVALARAQNRLREQGQRLDSAWGMVLNDANHTVKHWQAMLDATRPQRLVSQERKNLHQWRRRLARVQRAYVTQTQQRLEQWCQRLYNTDPKRILNRGYSITRLQKTGQLLGPQAPCPVDTVLVTELAQNVTVESKVVQPPKTEKQHPQEGIYNE